VYPVLFDLPTGITIDRDGAARRRCCFSTPAAVFAGAPRLSLVTNRGAISARSTSQAFASSHSAARPRSRPARRAHSTT